MKNVRIYYEDTCKLMRNYMEHVQPQRFASVWELFVRLKKQCELEGIATGVVEDIYEYAEKEHIEEYGF